MTMKNLLYATGPFRAAGLRSGDPYELSQGHPIVCMPTGGRGSRANLVGASVLDSDPQVQAAGVDTGYALTEDTLRAPDIAVGNVTDQPGWVAGAPPLAVEYADTGQDEQDLRTKIEELLAAGTRYIWVVRLRGPRRVQVYESGREMKMLGPGEMLTAPGILKNPVPVEALYDRDAAHEMTLCNLLQRRGYANLEAVFSEGEMKGREKGEVEGRVKGEAEGRAKGKADGIIEAILELFATRDIDISNEVRAQLATATDADRLKMFLRAAAISKSSDEWLLMVT
ncbi:Uma2 domain-containing protein [Gammaproteobacteria bacterium]